MSSKQTTPPWEVVAQCQAALYEWSESLDTKNWPRLLQCLAPTLHIDYRAIMPQGQVWDALPSGKFAAMVSGENFLGDETLKTQHFIGATKWIRVGDGHVVSHQQMRVAHQKYTDNTLKEVAFKGHAHGNSKVDYLLVDGEWKFAGLEPGVWWTEYNYEKLFEEKLG